MAPEEKIIEFQTVKKGRTIIFIALIAVFALASVGFLLLWILKSPGIDAGVAEIQMQGNLLQVSTDSEGNGVYVASANVEYTVYADISVFGDVTPSIAWIPSPSQYFVVDPSKNGIDPANPNRFFYTFTIAHDAPDGAAAQVMAKSKTSGEVTALYNFTIKAQYTDEFTITEVKGASGSSGESKPREFVKNAGESNVYSITLPYFVSSITNAETLNTNYISFSQLGALGINGERAKLTKGIPGTNPNYVVNAIEYELVNMSAPGVAAFDITAGTGGIESGSVQNKDDMTSFKLLNPGTFRLKATANKYNSSDDIVLYLDVTVKDITTFENVLSSISITEGINLYVGDAELNLADPSKNLISFSRPAPAGTSWKYEIYESEPDGTEIKSNDAKKLTINGTRLSPLSKPGKTYITIKDTSANGFGVSDTKPVNIYAPIKSLAVSYQNAVSGKNVVQRRDKLNFTAAYNITNDQGHTLAGGIGLNYTLEFTYAKAHEPVPEPGSTTRFSNAADTVTFDAMEYVDTVGGVRIYKIDFSRNTAYSIVLSADNKTATLKFDATVGSNAKLDAAYSILFSTLPQSRTGTSGISAANPVSFSVSDVITHMEFKTDLDEKPALGDDRFFTSKTGSKDKQYLIRTIGNSDTTYSLMSLIKFYNGSTLVANTDNTLPYGITVSPKDRFVGGTNTTTYRFRSNSDANSDETEITIAVTSGQTTTNYYLYLKYENTPSSLELTASGSTRVINYTQSARIIDTATGNATSSDIGLSGDTLKVRYAANSNVSTDTVEFYTYIFATDKNNTVRMLTHKAEGNNTAVYLSGDAGAPKLFTISGIKSVNLEADLFALSMQKIKNSDSVWAKLDNFIVAYSLIPLKPGSDGIPEINTPYTTGNNTRYYDDYTYGDERTNKLIQFRNYKAYRAFDDAAFYTDSTYSAPLDNTGDPTAHFSRNINAPTQFTLYPSGIISYTDYTDPGRATKNLTYQKEIQDSASPLKTTLNIVTLGNITVPEAVKHVSGHTYYVSSATPDEKFEVKLALNTFTGAATKKLTLIYKNDELKVKSFEFYGTYKPDETPQLSGQISSGSIISLVNGASPDVQYIYIKIIYNAYSSGTHVRYEDIKPYLNGNIFDGSSSGNLVLLEIFEPLGIKPGAPITATPADPAAPVIILQIKMTSNNKNGSQTFSFNNLNNIIASVPVLNIDVTTVAASFDIKHGNNNTSSVTTEILMTAKDESGTISLNDAVTETFTLSFNKNTDVTADPDILHLDWANATVKIYDNTASGADITSSAKLSASLASPGILTITTDRKCYSSLKITVNINFKTYKNVINANSTNASFNFAPLSTSFNIKILSEIFKIEFTDTASPANILSDITVRPTGGTAGNYEQTPFGVKYNGGDEDLGGIASAQATLTIESKKTNGDDSNYAELYFGDIVDNKLQILDSANPVPADVKIWLVASWTSKLNIVITHRIPIIVSTRDVKLELKNFAGAYTDDGDKTAFTTVDYFSTADMDLSLSLKNLWKPATPATDLTRYTISYLIENNPLWISLDNSKVKNTGGKTDTASFTVTATVGIKKDDGTVDFERKLKITVRLYYRANVIENTENLPGQTNTPAAKTNETIKVKLVNGYSFDLKDYFHLINTVSTAINQTDVWSQNFEVSVVTGGNEFLSIADTEITVIKAGGTDIVVTLKAAKNSIDSVDAVTRDLKITTYTPTFEAVADGDDFDSDIIKLKTKSGVTGAAAGEDIYVYNLFPASNTLPVKFELGGVVDSTAVTDMTVTFTDFDSLFTGTLNHNNASGIYSAAYSINNTILANEHITNGAKTQIYSAKLSFKADGIPVEKTLRFIITADLDDTQKQALAVKIKANGTGIADGGSIEIGIGSVAVTANVVDTGALIADMKTTYGATVTYILTVLGDADAELDSNIAEINGSTGEITIKASTAAFRVKAELNLKGIIYQSEILLAPTLPETANTGWPKAVITNASKLETRLYVGTAFNNKVLVSGTNEVDVSFDNPATNQKYLFVVVDYSLANYQYTVSTAGAFKPIVSGTGISGAPVEIIHEYASDKNLFYAKYLITGTGHITANGQITSKGIEYTSPAKTVDFVAPGPFKTAAVYINVSPEITLSANGTASKEITPDSASGFMGGISYSYVPVGDYSNFMTITTDADGKITFVLKNYNTVDLSKPISGTITLNVTASVTSGVYKNMSVVQTITVTVNPVAQPVFKKDTTALGIKSAGTANVEIDDSALVYNESKNTPVTVFNTSTMTGLFDVTKNASDTGFAFGTISIKVYNANDLSTPLSVLSPVGNVYQYTTPNYSANLTIVAELTVSGGVYAGVKYTVNIHLYVKPTITLTSNAANVSSGSAVTLTITADAYVNTDNLMNITLSKVSGGTLGALTTVVGEERANSTDPYIYTAQFVAAKGTTGGAVTIKADAIIGGGNVFSGQSFPSNVLTINVRSVELTADTSKWNGTDSSGWKTVNVSGARPKIVISTGSSIAKAELKASDLTSFITLSDSSSLSGCVVSIKLISGNYSEKINDTTTNTITVPKGENFETATFADALEVTVTRGTEVPYINYFTIEIAPDTAPAVTVSAAKYTGIDGTLTNLPASSHIYVGETIELSFAEANNYPFLFDAVMSVDGTPTSAYGHIFADTTNNKLLFTATQETPVGKTLKLDNFSAQAYGVPAAMSGVTSAEFKILKPSDTTFTFDRSATQLLNGGKSTVKVLKAAGGAAFDSASCKIEVAYETAIFSSVVFQNASGTALTPVTVTNGTTTIITYTGSGANGVQLEITAASNLGSGVMTNSVTQKSINVKIRYTEGGHINLFSSAFGLEMVDYNRNIPAFSGNGGNLYPFYNDTVALAVTSNVINGMTVAYTVTSADLSLFENVTAGTGALSGSELKLTAAAKEGNSAIAATVSAKITTPDGTSRTLTGLEKTFTFNPELKISVQGNETDPLKYEVVFDFASYGIAFANVNYSVTTQDNAAYEFGQGAGALKNIFTYKRKILRAHSFEATFTVTINDPSNPAYNTKYVSDRVVISIPIAEAPVINTQVTYSANAVDGAIITSVTMPDGTSGAAKVSATTFEYASDDNLTVDASEKKSYFALKTGGAFDRIPSLAGGKQWVKVTVTLGNASDYYKDKQYHTFVEVTVIPAVLRVSAAAKDLGGGTKSQTILTLSAKYLAPYEFSDTSGATFAIDGTTSPYAVLSGTNNETFTKRPTPLGGSVKVNAAFGVFTDSTTIHVEPASVLFTATPSGTDGQLTLEAKFSGIYSNTTDYPVSVTYAIKDESTVAAIDNLASITGASNNILRKQPTMLGGNIEVVATLTYNTTQVFEPSLNIYVEPASISFTATPSGTAGQLTLSAALTGIYSNTTNYPLVSAGYAVIAQTVSNIASIGTGSNIFNKLPTESGGMATVRATLTYGSVALTKNIEIDVEPANVVFTAAPSNNEMTLSARYTGLYAGYELDEAVEYEIASDVTEGGGTTDIHASLNNATLTKLPTNSNGTVTVTANLTYGGITRIVSLAVPVEKANVLFTVKAQKTGNAESGFVESKTVFSLSVEFMGIYSSFTGAATPEFDSSVSTLASVNNTAKTLTKLPNHTGGSTDITATLTYSYTIGAGDDERNISTAFTAGPITVDVSPTTLRIVKTTADDAGALSSSVKTYYSGMFSDIEVTSGVTYTSSDTNLLSVTAGGVYTKKPTISGGSAKIIAAVSGFTSAEIGVAVERLDAALSFTPGAGRAGSISLTYRAIYTSSLSGMSTTFGTTDSSLISVSKTDNVSATYTHKLSKTGGSAKITASFTIPNGGETVNLTAEPGITVDPFMTFVNSTPGTISLTLNTGFESLASSITASYTLNGTVSEEGRVYDNGLITFTASNPLDAGNYGGTYVKKLSVSGDTASITITVTTAEGQFVYTTSNIQVEKAEVSAAISYSGADVTVTPSLAAGVAGATANVSIKSDGQSGNLIGVKSQSGGVFTFTKKPTQYGGMATVVVTYTQGSVTTAPKDYSFYVEPFSGSLTASGEGYTGAAILNYNSIYSSLVDSASIEYSTDDDDLIDLDTATGEYTIKLVAVKGNAIITGTITFADDSALSFDAVVRIAATPVANPTVVDGGLTGTITPAHISGASATVTVREDSENLLEKDLLDNEDGSWTYTKLPTMSGGPAYYTVKYFVGTVEVWSKDYSIDVPKLAELSVNSVTGVITLTVNPIFESIIDRADYSLQGSGADVYEDGFIVFTPATDGTYGGIYEKKLSKTDGGATITITLKIGEDEFDYAVNITVEKVVIVESQTETEPNYAGEISAALKYENDTSAMDGVTVSVRFIEKENLLNISGYANGKFTYTKNFIEGSGTVKFVIVYTRDAFSIESGVYEIEVEPFFISFDAVDEAADNTGSAVLSYNSIYEDLIVNIVYSTTDINLIDLNPATGGYAKKLVTADGVATITATVTFKDGTQLAPIDFFATVDVDAELDISIDISDVQGSDVTATISASFKAGSSFAGTLITVTKIAVITNSENVLTNLTDTTDTISWAEGETDIGEIVIEITMEFGEETITVPFVIIQLPDSAESAEFVQP